MAGILDFLGLNDSPVGGILGNPATQVPPTAAPTSAAPNWMSKIGMFGAGLADAGATLSGHPADATNAIRFQQILRQTQLRQAYSTAASATDPDVRQQAYGQILAAGGDPKALQDMQASKAMPALLANMQPSQQEQFNSNPVGVTPALNATGPQALPQRQAAQTLNAAPDMSMQTVPGMNLMDAMKATGSPELAVKLAGPIFNNQLEVANKSLHPASVSAKIAGGYNADDPVMTDIYGNLSSPVKPQAEVSQNSQILANQPQTPEQKAELNLQYSQLHKPVAVGMGASLVDPVSGKTISGGSGFSAGAASNPDGTPITGADYLKTLPANVAATVKAIGDYRQQLSPMMLRTPEGLQISGAVNQYNPSFDATQFGAKTKARNDFTTGKNGNTVRSLNVAIAHLDTLGHLTDALDNGNIPVANAIGQSFAQQTGGVAPTNFDTAKQIVGDEIVKAITGGGGGVQDREKAQAVISRANTPSQLKGAIQTYQQLLGGQLGGLRQQYSKSTGLQDFNDYLSPETQGILGGQKAAPAAAPLSPQSLPRLPGTGTTKTGVKFKVLGN